MQTTTNNDGLIRLGTATGFVHSRGVASAPLVGQAFGPDIETMRYGTAIFGPPGRGKTVLLKRFVDEAMKTFKSSNRALGFYSDDGKGTNWQDFLKLSSIIDRMDEVHVVGTDPGMYGCDLMRGNTPLKNRIRFSAAAQQMGGGVESAGKDAVWTQSRDLVFMMANTIGRVLQYDPAQREDKAWGDMSPFSPFGTYRLAADEGLRANAFERIVFLSSLAKSNETGFRTYVGEGADELYRLLTAPHERAALKAAMWYYNDTFLKLAEQTRSSITMNLDSLLGQLSGTGELYQRFLGGRYAKQTSVEHCHRGGILMNAIDLGTWGDAGKLCKIWMKSDLFDKRMQALKTEPQLCDDVSLMFVNDECQMSITNGIGGEAEFTAVSRATGMFLVYATQGYNSLIEAIGEKTLNSLLNLYQNRFLLQTDEQSSVKWACEQTGSTMRGMVVDASGDYYATQTDRERAVPDVAPPAAPDEEQMYRSIKAGRLGLTTVGQRNRLTDARTMLRYVDRMRNAVKGVKEGGGVSVVNTEMQVFQRAEDKEKEARGGDLSPKPVLEPKHFDIGMGYAWASVMRGGLRRTDIIDLFQEEQKTAPLTEAPVAVAAE